MTSIFSEQFWLERVPNNHSFFYTESGQIVFSSTPQAPDAQKAAFDRARAFWKKFSETEALALFTRALKACG